MKSIPETRLPVEVLARASLRGNEFAWPVEAIPVVIEAVRQCNLVNLGGQLQFRFPEGIYECYWIEVDTYRSLPESLVWTERVVQSAAIAQRDFAMLCANRDFLAEGWEAFGNGFGQELDSGFDPRDAMCFVWYAEDERRS